MNVRLQSGLAALGRCFT